MTLRFAPFCVLVLLAAGCSKPEPPPTDQPPDPEAAAQQERDKQLLHAIQQPIQKAQGVEDTTLKAADEQKQQIEDQGG